MACEQRDLLHVRVLSMRSEVPHLHVLGHASSKRCHWKAPLRDGFVSQTTFPPLRNDAQVATDSGSIEIPAALESAIRCIPRSGLVQYPLNWGWKWVNT